MIVLPFKTSPFYSLIFTVKYIADALIPACSIFITADFINSAAAVYNGSKDISSVYLPVALLSAVMLYNAVIGTVMNFIDCRRNIHFRRKLVPEILEKRAKLAYRHIENPQTADLTERICPDFSDNIWEMFTEILNAVSLSLYTLGVFAALFTQVWWAALCMLLSLIPMVYISSKSGKRSYEADKELSKTERRMNYLSDLMKNRSAVEERSMYGYTGTLNNQYAANFEYARKLRLKVQAGNFRKTKTGGALTSLYSLGIMLALMIPVSNGSIDLGMFIGLMNAVFGLSSRLSWTASGIAEGIVKKGEYFKDLTKFMQLEEYDGATDLPVKNMTFKSIEFKNVSFKYPETDKLILNDISFTIENGRHYSLVGINGAGKSTIIKLITGLYTNYEGEILIDGRSIRDLSQSEIKGLSSVVYQDFAKYYISLYDNIAIADMGNADNRENVKNAIELVGLSGAVSKLKSKLDTPLGKIQENGVDLSGGEWQRIAMARSVINNAPLKILDEPTAALDPVSESAVYNNFERISKGKTTIFISHRLGSTKLADIIYVLSGGKIIEGGSHSELMKVEDGVYAEMFNSQAEWYKTGAEVTVNG
jgi:ABC-type multidrug transport system fused ATPase/permease subunit